MKIKKLEVRGCDVEDITVEIFQDLSELEVLDLSNNKMNKLDFLQTLPDTMKEIYLDHNGIEEVPDSFSNLKNLQIIDLSFCKLESLDFTVFKNNLNLTLVNVSHNNIQNSVSEEFLKNIKCVDMSYNKLDKYNNIPSYCLDLSYTGMAGYRWYNISEKNKTVFIEKFVFSGNNHLQLSATNINDAPLPIVIKYLNVSSFKGSVSDLELNKVKVRKELILKDSTIPSLEKSTYDFKLLFFDEGTNATFDLSNCTITEISPFYFEKYSLGRLNLCHNKFLTLKDKVFKDAYIIQLDLCNSSIGTIGDHTFQDLHSILLNLSRNDIEDLGFLKVINDVQILDLSYNKIRSITPESFSNLTHLRILYLNDNSISVVESGSFGLDSIEVIKLCSNEITEIRTMTFNGNTNLREIILLDNPLVAIETNAFKSLPALEIIDLGNMKITSIQPQAFNNLQNLGVVYLNANNLTELNQNVFVNVPILKEIRLEGNCLKNIEVLNGLKFETLKVKVCDNSQLGGFHNPSLKYLYIVESDLNNLQGLNSRNLLEIHFVDSPITVLQPSTLSGLFSVRYINGRELFKTVEILPKYVFQDMRSLNNLDLSGLVIRIIEPRAFVGLVNLEELSLANNRIVELHNCSFCGLNNMNHLDLSNNGISVIETRVFDGIEKINRLNLNNNNLSIIPLGTFNNISSLRVLFLSNNKIDYISTGTFSNLPNLRTLDISNNRINNICSGTFFPLINLEELNLEGNKLILMSSSDLLAHSPKLNSILINRNNFGCEELKSILYDFRKSNVSVGNGVENLNFSSHNIDGISCRSNCI
ncbi:uncharacterized protein [Leptinotarsa decemlineata]|uniref:uncharacterized protein n=1 Tax=Leptinotarsa decemlineata TaxID=7539 RepID=UPI003D30C004